MRPSRLALAALLLLPAMASAPTAEAGSSCEILLVTDASASCTFFCFRGDALVAGVFTSAGRAAVAAECGGALTACESAVPSYGAVCTSAPGAANGVGTCTASVYSPLDSPLDASRARIAYTPSRASCGAYGGDATPFDCIHDLDVRPGAPDDIAEHIGNDPCTSLYWLIDHANARPAHEVYHYHYPGCDPPSCRLDVAAPGLWQPHPDDPTAPFYKGPPSDACTTDDVCLVVEHGMGAMVGWRGTTILQCSPGSSSTSVHAPAACGRAGANAATLTTDRFIPHLRALSVPFGQCRIHMFEQAVSATLLKGPLGETYEIPSESQWSNPRAICNGARSSSAYDGRAGPPS